MDKGTGKDAFTRSMAKVNESATRYIKSVVPTLWIPVSPIVLYPLKNKRKRLEFEFSVCNTALPTQPLLINLFHSCYLALADGKIGN